MKIYVRSSEFTETKIPEVYIIEVLYDVDFDMSVYFSSGSTIKPVKLPDGSIDQQELANYDCFADNIYSILCDYFEVVDVDFSDRSDTSRYFYLYAKNKNGEIATKIILRLRLSDHEYSERHIKDVFESTQKTEQLAQETKSEVQTLSERITKLQSAQRTGLQTQILEKCRRIQIANDEGDVDYEEELKQLIILYREYHLCGFNSQGKLYFNDTIEKASEDNNTLVRGLMNTYFSEYKP